MNVFTLKAEQWIPRPIEDVFPFFSDPRNLDVLTPGGALIRKFLVAPDLKKIWEISQSAPGIHFRKKCEGCDLNPCDAYTRTVHLLTT